MIITRGKSLGWAPTYVQTPDTAVQVSQNYVEITPSELKEVAAENLAAGRLEAARLAIANLQSRAARATGLPMWAVGLAGGALAIGAGVFVWKKFKKKSRRSRR